MAPVTMADLGTATMAAAMRRLTAGTPQRITTTATRRDTPAIMVAGPLCVPHTGTTPVGKSLTALLCAPLLAARRSPEPFVLRPHNRRAFALCASARVSLADRRQPFVGSWEGRTCAPTVRNKIESCSQPQAHSQLDRLRLAELGRRTRGMPPKEHILEFQRPAY